MVSFCENCGALLIPNRQKNNKVKLFCKNCNSESKTNYSDSSYQVKSRITHSEKDKLTVIEEDFDVRPLTRITCPRCNNSEARYWEAEDRKKQEWEAILYYKCTKCGWVWSE